MYLFEDMVDMALPEGVHWPSNYHRTVAIYLLIANPDVRTLEGLRNGVLSVLRIPEEHVKTIVLDDLRPCGYGYSMILGRSDFRI